MSDGTACCAGVTTVVSMRESAASASCSLPCPANQRGDSGISQRSPSASTAGRIPSQNMDCQPKVGTIQVATSEVTATPIANIPLQQQQKAAAVRRSREFVEV